MMQDKFGQSVMNSSDLVSCLYLNPDLEVEKFKITDPEHYNTSIEALHLSLPKLDKYHEQDLSIEDFDLLQQNQWLMPEQYKNMDIAAWVLAQCKDDHELQRAGQELLKFQERNLFPLLCYLKYFVDTMRSNKVLWGVGRGSSVASFVLYIIGVHRINSLYYDLDINEFLKD